MKIKSTKILYTYTEPRSFVVKDIAMLEKDFTVKPYQFGTNPKWKTPLSFILQLFYLLFQGWKYDVFMMFFAGYHSVLPCLFAKISSKKSIIILGGTDCFKYPSFNYGNFTKLLYGNSTCISAHNASLLIPVSENLVKSESAYYQMDNSIQGIYYWCSPLSTPYKTIPIEFDPNIFYRQEIPRQENSFITVAYGISGNAFIRKGIDKFILLASHFPQFVFSIVGAAESDLPKDMPSNISIQPPVPYNQLPTVYSRHEYYIQLSIAEGFPSAICEAMLCECIPIGSDVAAIPEIIGDIGLKIRHRNDSEILDGVRSFVLIPNKAERGKAARQRILEKYGPGTRERELKRVIESSLELMP